MDIQVNHLRYFDRWTARPDVEIESNRSGKVEDTTGLHFDTREVWMDTPQSSKVQHFQIINFPPESDS